MAVKVYHTTKVGNGLIITKSGWKVTHAGTNIFGRGIYFWDNIDDAHRYGKTRYGEKQYEIVSETIPVTSKNSVEYDYNKARNSHIDEIARGLLSRGVDVMVITNPQIEGATMSSAKGKAYLWLVDMNHSHRVVKF